MTPINLPLDILDQVFGALAAEDTKRSNEALGSCTLLSHTLLPYAQRRLFTSIKLFSNAESSKLSALLSQSPHLALYVQDLFVSNLSPLEDLSLITSVIKALDKIRRLIIIIVIAIPFRALPEDLRAALLIRFWTVTALELSGIVDLPMQYVALCPQLKTLSIDLASCMVFHRIQQLLETGEPLIEETTHISENHHEVIYPLETLSIRGVASPFKYLSPLFGHALRDTLRSLCLEGISYETTVNILRGVWQSLTDITLQDLTGDFKTLDLIPVHIDLPVLERVEFFAEMLSPATNLEFLIMLLESGDSDSPRPLTQVIFSVFIPDIQFATNEIWTRIDNTLSAPRYCGLRMTAVCLFPPKVTGNVSPLFWGSREEGLDATKPFSQSLPKLRDMDKLAMIVGVV